MILVWFHTVHINTEIPVHIILQSIITALCPFTALVPWLMLNLTFSLLSPLNCYLLRHHVELLWKGNCAKRQKINQQESRKRVRNMSEKAWKKSRRTVFCGIVSEWLDPKNHNCHWYPAHYYAWRSLTKTSQGHTMLLHTRSFPQDTQFIVTHRVNLLL